SECGSILGLVPQSTACGMSTGPLYYFAFRCCSLIVVGLPGPNVSI
ncbi:Os10g0208500, partial [Oryza sativa Japonica Group]